MKEKQRNLGIIIEYLQGMENTINIHNKLGYTDVNKLIEDVFKGILNFIYGYSLTNNNLLKNNYPAIDLSDENMSVCYQVTSRNDKEKVLQTITKYKENKLNLKFKELNILMVCKKRPTKYAINDPSINFYEKNIIDLDDLITIIGSQTNETLQKIIVFLNSEIKNKITFTNLDNIKKFEFEETDKLCENYISRKVIDINEESSFWFSEKGKDFKEILQNNKKIVLIGDAAQGKSELAKKIVEEQNEQTYGFSYIKRLNNYTGENIEDLIYENYKEIEHKLVVAVFDGLDEIEERFRSVFIKKIQDYCKKNKEYRVVITSRSNIYNTEIKTITGFAVFSILPFTKQQINKILISNQINVDQFNRELDNKDLENIFMTPFYLFPIIKIYKENNNLPVKMQLMDKIIELYMKDDIVKYKDTTNEELQNLYPHILNEFQKVGFAFECYGKNSLSKNEFDKIKLKTEYKNYFKYISFWKQKNNDEFMFIHNNFGEYFAAKFLLYMPIKKVKKIICYKESAKIKSTWKNTLKFLSILNVEFQKWIIKIYPEFIFNNEYTQETNIDSYIVCKKYFEDIKNKLLWIDYDVISNKEFMNYISNDKIINYLIKQIDGNKHFVIVANALLLLQNICPQKITDKSKKILENSLKTIIDSDKYRLYEKHYAINVLTKFDVLKQIELDEIIINNKKHEDAYLRMSYFNYYNNRNESDTIIDKILSFYDVVYERSYQSTVVSGESNEYEKIFEKIKKSESINKILSFLEQKKNLTELDRNFVRNIINVISIVSKSEEESIELYYKFCKILESIYDRTNLSFVVGELSKEIRLQIFKNAIFDDDREKQMHYFGYELLCESQELLWLCREYETKKIEDEKIEMALRFTNCRDRNYQMLLNNFKKNNPQKFCDKKIATKEEDIQAESELYDSLFSLSKFMKIFKKYLSLLDQKEIVIENIHKVDYALIEEFPVIKHMNHFLHRYFNTKRIINFQSFSDVDWELIIFDETYKRLNDKEKIVLEDYQEKKVKEICTKLSYKVNFRNAIVKHEDNRWEFNSLAIKLLFFLTKLRPDYEEKVLLDMLSFDYNLSNLESGFEAIVNSISDRSKLNDRIICNIESQNIFDFILVNHIEYCIKQKLSISMKTLDYYLFNANTDDASKLVVCKYIMSNISANKFIEEYLDKLSPYIIKNVLVDIKKNKHNKKNLIKRLWNAHKKQEQKHTTLILELISFNSKKALKQYFKQLKNEGVASNFFTSGREYDVLSNIKSKKMLFQLLNIIIDFRKGKILEDDFEKLSNNILESIINIIGNSKKLYIFSLIYYKIMIVFNSKLRKNITAYYDIEKIKKSYMINSDAEINAEQINSFFID